MSYLLELLMRRLCNMIPLEKSKMSNCAYPSFTQLPCQIFRGLVQNGPLVSFTIFFFLLYLTIICASGMNCATLSLYHYFVT